MDPREGRQTGRTTRMLERVLAHLRTSTGRAAVVVHAHSFAPTALSMLKALGATSEELGRVGFRSTFNEHLGSNAKIFYDHHALWLRRSGILRSIEELQRELRETDALWEESVQ